MAVDRNKLSILVVDDDPGMLETLVDVLDMKGFRVQGVSSGEEAVSLAAATRMDFILMDIKMPGMDGVEATRAVKKIQPETRISLMTGYAMDDLIETGLHVGACCVHKKPLDLDKLIGILDTMAMNVQDRPGT